MTVEGVPGLDGLQTFEITDDGRIAVAPMPQRADFPSWSNYWSDFGDDVDAGDANLVVGRGPELKIAASTAGEHTLVWQYADAVQAQGGQAWSTTPFNPDDEASVEIFTPPSVVTEGGVLNAVLSEVAPGSGMNIIVPVPEGNGTHEIDLEYRKPGTHVGNLALVPAYDAEGNTNGYFDYDVATDVVTPNYDGTGKYNAFDFEIRLLRYLNRIRVRDGDRYDGNRARTMLPGWKWRAILIHAGPDGRDVDISFRIFLIRERTF